MILVKTLVNLPVKTNQIRSGGCHRGLGSGEYTRERLVPLGVAKNPATGHVMGLGPTPNDETITKQPLGWDGYETVMRLLWDYC